MDSAAQILDLNEKAMCSLRTPKQAHFFLKQALLSLHSLPHEDPALHALCAKTKGLVYSSQNKLDLALVAFQDCLRHLGRGDVSQRREEVAQAKLNICAVLSKGGRHRKVLNSEIKFFRLIILSFLT